ncbi:hypothetical protein L1049_015018 [Liquidambar formosana]|uniref:ULTRAPETALA1/2 SAND domain-containing protein n=1 Tax=Liquidambar formosana TaxID=63359 RepID=A0AAP0RY99_LIQFO
MVVLGEGATKLKDISGLRKGPNYVEFTCGCTRRKFGDAIGKLTVFADGRLAIKCECNPACQEGNKSLGNILGNKIQGDGRAKFGSFWKVERFVCGGQLCSSTTKNHQMRPMVHPAPVADKDAIAISLFIVQDVIKSACFVFGTKNTVGFTMTLSLKEDGNVPINHMTTDE